MQVDARLIQKKIESIDTETFRFYLENFSFKAGQYVLMELDVKDEKGNDRPFTISSSPLDPEYIEITTKISQSPFKQKLHSLKIGEHVKLIGPLGKFTFQEANYSVMIAGGIGITPFRSIIRTLTQARSRNNIILLYSNKVPEEIVFKHELEELQRLNNHICLITTITKPEESKDWQGLTGRINEEFIKNNTENVNIDNYYICGPPSMVGAMLELLKSMKIPEDKIKIERFIGY